MQPLLTPDNYAEHALTLIHSAKKSVWFQNQYINFRGTGRGLPDFKRLVGALKDQIDKGRDVRIICRDMMKQESLDVLVALGFPRTLFRFQPACHNKTIIVDGKVVMFGSHNWSNEGVKTNRDASLIFDDEEIAAYLAEVYEYDWTRLATAKPTRPPVRVARGDEPTPRRLQARAVLRGLRGLSPALHVHSNGESGRHGTASREDHRGRQRDPGRDGDRRCAAAYRPARRPVAQAVSDDTAAQGSAGEVRGTAASQRRHLRPSSRRPCALTLWSMWRSSAAATPM